MAGRGGIRMIPLLGEARGGLEGVGPSWSRMPVSPVIMARRRYMREPGA